MGRSNEGGDWVEGGGRGVMDEIMESEEMTMSCGEVKAGSMMLDRFIGGMMVIWDLMSPAWYTEIQGGRILGVHCVVISSVRHSRKERES